MEDNTTVKEVLLKLGVDINEPWNASLNGMLAKPTDVLYDGSLLLVFPPIAGG
ncbi:MAG: MoaD/ThiS family protein [Dehalococcoidia bacterium]